MPRFQGRESEARCQRQAPRGDGMGGPSTALGRSAAWIRSLARLFRPLPALLLRLLLGLPARWLQLVALAWGALVGRDRLLLHADEEENGWQEMLHALGGGGLHSKGLYLGTEPLLWESGGKGMSGDVLEGLPADLLDGIPAELLEGLPAELMHRHLKMIGADEGPLQIKTFPGFGLMSCVLGAHWTEYQTCGKDTGIFPESYSRGEECKEQGFDKHSPWQSPDREMHTSTVKLGSGTANKWTEHTEFVSKRTALPTSYSKLSEPTESVSKWTEPHRRASQCTESPMTANKRAEPESNSRRTEPLTYVSLKMEAAVTAWEQPLGVARDQIKSNTDISEISGTDPSILLAELPRSGSDHAPQSLVTPSGNAPQAASDLSAAEGPGSLTSDCDATKQATPELQLIRMKRLDFLQQLSKSDLLPSPDQDHGYCSLEETLMLQQPPSTHISSSVYLPLQHQDHDTPFCTASHPYLGQDIRVPSSCETFQPRQHQDPNNSSSASHLKVLCWQNKAHETSYSVESFWQHPSSHETGEVPLFDPNDPSFAAGLGTRGTFAEGGPPVVERDGSTCQRLVDTRKSSKVSGQLYTHVADDHDGDGIDSDIEEDLPAPVRPVCSNKLIDYILGAGSSDEDGESSDSDGDWDKEEGDDGFGSEGSLSVPEDSDDLQLWNSFCTKDPYNPQNFTATIETAQKVKEEQAAEGSDLSDSSDSEESSWGESSPGSVCTSSDEDSESECSADEEENLKLWNSFNNSDDPYNPLHFKASFQTQPSAKPVGCTYKSFKLGTNVSHSRGLLAFQMQPNEIIDVRLVDPANFGPSCGVSSKNTKQKKVMFVDEVTEHYVGNEDRKGPWEEYARDRCRFQKRIQETECAIGHCFSPQHRRQLWCRILKEHCS